MHTYEKRDAKSRTIVIVCVAALALLVSLGVYGIVRLMHKPAAADPSVQAGGLVYDSSAVEGGWENLSPEELRRH